MIRGLAAAALLAAARAASAGEVELACGEDVLSHGRGSWRLVSLEATAAPAARTSLLLAARGLERSDARDAEAAAGVTLPAPWSARGAIGVEGTASATHRFVPAWSGGVRAEQGLGAGLVASAGLRGAWYGGDPAAGGGARTALASAGLERYLGRWRLAGTGYLAGVAGAWSGSGRLAADLFLGERDRVGVAVSAGRELESAGGGRLLASDVVAVALGGRHGIAAAWAVTWELGVQRQGELYTRAGARLGLRRRF
jgi:YaiO family outer membrane protein